MEKVELEPRVCACGCGRKFKVLPRSDIRYGSLECQLAAKAIDPAKINKIQRAIGYREKRLQVD